MKPIVVLISPSGMDSWWRNTVLGRTSLDVHCAHDFQEGYRLLVNLRRDLLVVEDWPGADGFLPFVKELTGSLSQQHFKAILVTNRVDQADMRPPVCEVLPIPCHVDEINRSVVAALDLTPRAGQRHLVRFHVGAEKTPEITCGTVVTLQINAGGMLVESPQHIPEGRRLLWTFHGIPELKDVVIPGTVLRREGTPHPHRGFHYVVGFAEEAKEQRARLAKYLEEMF